MEFRKLDNKYIEDCVNIAFNQYCKEQKLVAALYDKDYKKEIYKLVQATSECGNGVMAFEEDKLVGYLAFSGIWEETVGSDIINAIACPLCGYGISEGYDRAKVVSLMFQYASEILCEKAVALYNIKVYAHDTEVIASYVLNNFGILCTDAIRSTDSTVCSIGSTDSVMDIESLTSTDSLATTGSPISTNSAGKYVYKELSKEEINKNEEELLKLWRALVKHLRTSPTYYPGEEFTNDAYLEYIHDENTRLFVAKDDENTIGMMDVSRDGNSFINRECDTMNVGDLFFKPNYRGHQAAEGLLSYVNDTLRKEGVKRIWVEHGTTNPTAQRFWGKYFCRFTYTLTREIDGRIFNK